MSDFLEQWRVPIILLLLAIIGIGLIVLYLHWPHSVSPTTGPTAANLAGLPVIRTAEPRQIKVHVAGAVEKPGVYVFHEGDRVQDAVAAAGALPDADLDRLNLAQRLRDEAYIAVPRIGETPAATGAGSTPMPAAQSGKLNINAASAKELEALPGIGATYAQRIVDYRTKNGPFQTIQQLVDAKIIPKSTFDKIKDLIDVH